MAVQELRDVLPGDRVITEPSVIEGYRRDEAQWAAAGKPLAVVRPRHTDEVVSVVRFCLERGIPIVPRGAGSGVSGGANAIDGSILLAMEAMDGIVYIDAAESLAVVQPGVVNGDLRRACAAQGLWYPPDPASASWSTIGGNVATNAGGLCCLKYGVTRDYVLGLRVVTGVSAAAGGGAVVEGGAVVGDAAGVYGDVVRLGRRTTKGVAGLDLTALLVGSEGTLGVITEITLRLRRRWPARRARSWARSAAWSPRARRCR